METKKMWNKLEVKDVNFAEVVGHINASARSYEPYEPAPDLSTPEKLFEYMYSGML